MKPEDRKLVRALIPWAGAAAVWLLVAPSASEDAERLARQSHLRRDRATADRASGQVEALKSRAVSALSSACRASSDAAALRQRAVAAAAGLDLRSFSLAVSGGAGGGATVDTVGSRAAIDTLVARLGDPARGGFLRSASVRTRESSFAATVTTGVINDFKVSGGVVRPCAERDDSPKAGPSPSPAPTQPPRPRPVRATPTIDPTPSVNATVEPVAPEPATPFTLVGFVGTARSARVSVKLGDEIRIVGLGDSVAGWRCVAIVPPEGATFERDGRQASVQFTR